jgi:hypothetical protein
MDALPIAIGIYIILDIIASLLSNLKNKRSK